MLKHLLLGATLLLVSQGLAVSVPGCRPQAAFAQPIGARNNFKVGRTYFEKEDYEHAIEAFQKAVKEEPHYPDAIYLIGMSYYGLKKYDKAKEFLEKTITMEAGFFPAYANLGNVYIAEKKYKEAKAHFQHMMSVPKAAPTATYCLGVLAYVQQDLKEAEKQWRETLRLDSKNARARNNLGVLHEAEDRKKEALTDYIEASRLDPPNPGYITSQAFVQFDLGNKTGAKTLLDKAKRFSDKRHDIGFVAEGLNQFIDGRYDKTIVACNAALKLNPELTQAELLKARALEAQKKPEEARKSYEAVIESDPNVKEAKLALDRIKSADPAPKKDDKPEASPTPPPKGKAPH